MLECKTILERAYNALMQAGVDVRLATRHTGVCEAPYCVIYEGEAETGKSIAVRRLLADVLVPAAKPELLSGQMERIRATMKAADFSPGLTGPAVALEDYKAVSATMEFVALCAL